MRGRVLAVVLAAATALAGCDQASDLFGRVLGSDQNGAHASGGRFDQRVEDVVSAEPGKDRQQWRAADNESRAVLGNLTASQPDGRTGPVVLAFANGVTVSLEAVGVFNGSERTYPDGQSFADALGSDPKAGVYVYKIGDENIDQVATQGGLCKEKRPSHVAISEYVSATGDWVFRVAAFEGPAAPGPGSPGDPGLCGRYVFTLG